VAGWFADNEDETGLIVCRVKNKFSATSVHVTDGYPLLLPTFFIPTFFMRSVIMTRTYYTTRYRDFQMCVVFTDANGLKIIGEIQVSKGSIVLGPFRAI
jgi:hypothetical protein